MSLKHKSNKLTFSPNYTKIYTMTFSGYSRIDNRSTRRYIYFIQPTFSGYGPHVPGYSIIIRYIYTLETSHLIASTLRSWHLICLASSEKWEMRNDTSLINYGSSNFFHLYIGSYRQVVADFILVYGII